MLSLSFFVLQVAHSRKRRTFYTTSYLQGQWKYGKAKEAVESTRAGLSKQKGDVRKLRKEKKRKEKDQGRREGGSSEGKVPCALNQEFLFFGSRVFGFRSGPSRLKYRLLHSFPTRKPCAKEIRKRTTLRSESSTLKGLLYAPIQQKQYHKKTTVRRLKIPLQSIVPRKVRTIAMEQSAKKAVMRHVINAIWHGYIENLAAKHS